MGRDDERRTNPEKSSPDVLEDASGLAPQPATSARPVRPASLGLHASKFVERGLRAVAIATIGARDHYRWRTDSRTRSFAERVIEAVPGLRRHPTRAFAVFVYYSRLPVSVFVSTALEALAEQGLNVVIAANQVDESARQTLLGQCHTLMIRNDVGRDFGAYKDGIDHVLAHECPERLVLLNDSIFWEEAGAREMVAHLATVGDFACATETYAQHYHANAFALGFSKAVLDASAFCEFWRDYRLVNNRRHAINNGEVELSRRLLDAGFVPEALYSTAALRRRLAGSTLAELRQAFTFLPSWMPESRTSMEQERDAFSRLVQDEHPELARAAGIDRLIQVVSLASQIHVGGFLFKKWLGMPILKRDAVYRGLFRIDHFERCLDEAGVQHAREIMADIRRKGLPEYVRGWNKVLHGAGLY